MPQQHVHDSKVGSDEVEPCIDSKRALCLRLQATFARTFYLFGAFTSHQSATTTQATPLQTRLQTLTMPPEFYIDDPIELDDGRTLVCRRHRWVVCGKCCVDYSFMQDIDRSSGIELDDEPPHWLRLNQQLEDDGGESKDDNDVDDNDDDDEQLPSLIPSQGEGQTSASNVAISILPSPRRGVGRVQATEFVSASTPETLFVGRRTYAHFTRYVDRQDAGRVLIFTDGACLNNGQQNPRAGWAFVHGPRAANDAPSVGDARTVYGRLENTGPFGNPGKQTSNRAELRAVIAALKFRSWPGEGFHTMVIATDSTYIVDGATGWVRGWVLNGWKTRTGEEVKNRDLWECLLGRLEDLASRNLDHPDKPFKVQFWKIPRAWNTIADTAAKQGAQQPEVDCQVEFLGI